MDVAPKLSCGSQFERCGLEIDFSFCTETKLRGRGSTQELPFSNNNGGMNLSVIVIDIQ